MYIHIYIYTYIKYAVREGASNASDIVCEDLVHDGVDEDHDVDAWAHMSMTWVPMSLTRVSM